MALQSSGAISFSQIAAHFGGSTPHSMSEYYTLLGMGVTGLPSSGTFAFSNFHGKSNQVITSVWVSSGYSDTIQTVTSPASSFLYWGDSQANGNNHGWVGDGVNFFYEYSHNYAGSRTYNGATWVPASTPGVPNPNQGSVLLNKIVFSTVWVDTSAYVNTTTTAQI
jgi:hypothetical protein